jgi:hypothetical protein
MEHSHHPEAGHPVGWKPQFPGNGAGQLGNPALVASGIGVPGFGDRGQGLNGVILDFRCPGQAFL